MNEEQGRLVTIAYFGIVYVAAVYGKVFKGDLHADFLKCHRGFFVVHAVSAGCQQCTCEDY